MGSGVVYRRQGDVHRAISMLERAMDLCQDWHIPLFLPRQTAALGLAYALEGRVAAGLAMVEHGVEQAVAAGIPWNLALVVTCLSEAYLLAGRRKTRANVPRRLSSSPTSTSNAAPRPGPCGSWGEHGAPGALSGRGRPWPLSPGPRSGRGAGHASAPGHCHRGLGTLYTRQGQHEQARTALSTAIELYRAMEMPFWLPQAEATLAQMA